MKHVLITIAVMVLSGCGESQHSAPAPEANSEPPTTEVSDISLIAAAEDGNIEAVKQNLAAGIDANTQNAWGVTPLHFAAKKGHKEIAELLIANGADVNAKDGDEDILGGTSPLFDPVGQGYTEIVELLIKKGADINLANNSGLTVSDLAWGSTSKLIRKHGGKTGKELKAEGK